MKKGDAYAAAHSHKFSVLAAARAAANLSQALWPQMIHSSMCVMKSSWQSPLNNLCGLCWIAAYARHRIVRSSAKVPWLYTGSIKTLAMGSRHRVP